MGLTCSWAWGRAQERAHRFFQVPQSFCHLLPCTKPEQQLNTGGSKLAPEGRGNILQFFFFQGWEEISNLVFTIVQLPILMGLGNTVQMAQTLRGLTLGVAGLLTPHCHQKTSVRGYAKVLSQGPPPGMSQALSISRARTCQPGSLSQDGPTLSDAFWF